MSREQWNNRDHFRLVVYSPVNMLGGSFEELEPVLRAIESLDAPFRPDEMQLKGPALKYSRPALRKRLHEARSLGTTDFMLTRSEPPEARFMLTGVTSEEETFCRVDLWVAPLSVVCGTGSDNTLAQALVAYVRALAACMPLSYGNGHSRNDAWLGEQLRPKDRRIPPRFEDVLWLNVFGPALVEQLGRQRVLSTPCAHLEELPHGAVLWLSRPTPADFDSEEARLAQARALIHLRPELSLETVMAGLRERSREFTPIPMRFEPDVADILLKEVEFEGIMGGKRKNVERFNQYQPLPVAEWLPASQVLAPDVGNPQAAIETYEGLYAEQLRALFHEKVPEVMGGAVEALPLLDWHLWKQRWGKNITAEQRAILVPALGAWLGLSLVNHLGGRWVPRRKLEEAAVIIGDRAWLPFLRASHALSGQDAPLDFSCTQLFRTARRLAPVHP